MRTVTAVLASALLLAGCHGGGSTFPRAAAQTTADRAVLQVEDLPGGWSITDRPSFRGADAAFFAPLGRCLRAPAGLFTSRDTSDSVIANSPIFAAPAGLVAGTAGESVIVTTLSRQDEVFALLHKPTATGCLTTTAKQLDRQPSLDPSETSRLRFPSMGSDSMALQLTTFANAGAEDGAILDTDIVFIRVGDASVILSFFSADDPSPWSTVKPIARRTEEQVARSAVRRLATTQAPRA
jgi:hypothetical protein